MQFSLRSALTVFATGLLAASGVQADDCSSGPMEGYQTWGKPDPKAIGYCHTKWAAGLVVSGIEVWSTNYHISGVQFTFNDGTKYDPIGGTVFGTNKGEDNMDDGGGTRHAVINWDPKENVTAFRMQTSKDGAALGLLHIEVGGQKLSVTSSGMGDGDIVNTGSGLLLGASGTHSGFVNSFTPLFMGGSNTVAQITDIKFDQSLDDLNKKQQGLTGVFFGQMYIANTDAPGGGNQSWAFTGTASKAISSTVSVTDTNGFSLSETIDVSAEIDFPLVAKVTTKSSTSSGWTTSKASTTATTTTDTFSQSWNLGSTTTGPLLPGDAKNCSAISTMGSYNGGFTSTIQITVGGKKYSYQQRGNFKSISYSNVFVSCSDIKVKDIPSGSVTQQAADTLKKSGSKRQARSISA